MAWAAVVFYWRMMLNFASLFVDALHGDLFIRSVARIYWEWFFYRLDELSFYVAAWLLARTW